MFIARSIWQNTNLAHKNKKWHNWLIYNIGEFFLKKYSVHYKGKLVDLGCGESPYKSFFLQYADSYVGVDWSSTLHQSRPDVISDLNSKIQLPDEFADTLISLSVMEHLCEPLNFLRESHRILRDGGCFILQVPWQWWVHEAPYDYFRYTPYGLKYLFEKAGFTEIIIEPQSGFFTTWILKFNYFSLRFLKGPKVLRLIVKASLIPIWCILQLFAPLLDKLDKNWTLESSGYYVLAKKNGFAVEDRP